MDDCALLALVELPAQLLAEVAEICGRVNRNGRTMGMALTPCTTPGSGEPSFELGAVPSSLGEEIGRKIPQAGAGNGRGVLEAIQPLNPHG